jgi:hypothetical protein
VIWRHQLPVYSPLSLGALAGGVGAALSGGGSAKARVDAWIRERYGARQVLLTDSGTSALALAMQAAVRRSPGKPILLPSYGCYDLVTAAMAAGVEVGWYDIEPTKPATGFGGAQRPPTRCRRYRRGTSLGHSRGHFAAPCAACRGRAQRAPGYRRRRPGHRG